jgi:hypothetical protein
MNEHDSIENLQFAKAYTFIQRNAPTWFGLFSSCLQNRRANRESYNQRPNMDTDNGKKNMQKRLFIITAIVCHTRSRNSSNFIHSLMDLYLFSHGTKGAVIDVLAGFGICHTYATANVKVNELTERCRVCT